MLTATTPFRVRRAYDLHRKTEDPLSGMKRRCDRVASTPFDDFFERFPPLNIEDATSTLSIPTGFLLSLSKVQSIEDAISVYADWGPRAIGAGRCSIAIINSSGDALTLLAVSGTEKISSLTTYPIHETLLGAVYQRKQPVIISDIQGINAPGLIVLDREGYKSSGLAPLVAGDQCFGVLKASFQEHRSVDDPSWTVLIVMARCLAMQMALLSQRDDLANLALHDQLTGLPNRHHYAAVIREVWRRKVELSKTYSLVIIDIDHFKSINDAHGHLTGDHVLKEVARCLKDHTPKDAICARIGGEEFLVILPDASIQHAGRFAEQCRRHLEDHPIAYNDLLVDLTCCFGVAEVSDVDTKAADTFDRADAALYQAKSAGRNKVVLASPPHRATD